MLRRSFLWILLVSFIMALFIYSIKEGKSTINSLTYFPNDPSIDFLKASTTLSMEPVPSSTNYKIVWSATSQTNIPVYLRQDVALLFQNGRLVQVSNKWKQNTSTLTHQDALLFQGIGKFDALTVHYAESHLANETIGSKEVMSYDHLYVLANGYEKTDVFKVPVESAETDFQREMTRSIQQEQQYITEQAAEKYQLNLADYDVFPLTHLEAYRQNTLPGLNKKTSQKVISLLWEGLYKNYILSIHVSPDTEESPLGSSMPLILYPKKNDHSMLYVIVRTKEGHLLLLKQSLKE